MAIFSIRASWPITRGWMVEADSQKEARNIVLPIARKEWPNINIGMLSAFPVEVINQKIPRRLCLNCLFERVPSPNDIHEGQLILIVPEHECEFYTDKPKEAG